MSTLCQISCSIKIKPILTNLLSKVKQAQQFKERLFKEFGEFKYRLIQLLAALRIHGGIGAIVIQWCPKYLH